MKDQLLNVFTESKSVLFLENDMGLYHVDKTMEEFLIENKRQYNALFDLQELSVEYVLNQIDWYDIIVFQSTWTYEKSRELREAMFTKKFIQPKIIVECFIHEPTWFYKPDGLAMDHRIYVFTDNGEHGELEDMSEWKFKELRTDKATWED